MPFNRRILDFKKITNKFLIFLVITSFIPIISIMGYARISMERQLQGYKEKELSYYEELFKHNLDRFEDYFKLIASDYAIWEDSYQKTLQEDHVWLDGNIVNWIPQQFNFTYTAVINTTQELLLENLDGFYHRFSHQIFTSIPRTETTELLLLDQELYLITIFDIQSESETESSSGKIILAELIDKNFIEEHIYIPNLSINLYLYEGLAFSNNQLELYIEENIPNNLESLQIDNILYHFIPIRNTQGSMVAYGILEIPYDFYINTENTLRTTQFLTYLLVITLFTLSIHFMNRSFIEPINHVRDVVKQIKLTREPIPINIYHNDEIGELAHSFNDLALEISNYNEELKTLAITDDITQLYNTRYLCHILDEKTSDSSPFFMTLIEIDFIKPYNNLFERSELDKILINIADIIRDLGVSLSFRLDASTFAVILEGNDLTLATKWIQKFQKLIVEMNFDGKELLPTDLINASAGISLFPTEANSKDSLFKVAEKKLHNAQSFASQRIGNYYSIFHGTTQEQINNLEDAYSLTKVLLSVIHSMDEYTLFHSESVAKYALQIGKRLNLSSTNLELLRYSSLLHDVGKIELGSGLLNKVGKLSDEEFAKIKMHPIYGINILCSIPQLQPVLPIVKHHHEWFDGQGYPDGLKGDEIPLLARIVAVADAYDSMTTHRPYRKGCRSHEEAIAELIKYSGTQFDPRIVEVFIEEGIV